MENLKFKFINLSNDVLEPNNIETIIKQTNFNYLSIRKDQLKEYENIEDTNLIIILPIEEAEELYCYESTICKLDSTENHVVIVLIEDGEAKAIANNFDFPVTSVVITSEELGAFIAFLDTISKEGFINFDVEEFWGQIHGKQNILFLRGNGCDAVSALNSLMRNLDDKTRKIEESKNFVLSIHSHAEASCEDFELISNMISRIIPDSSEIISSAVLEESVCGYEIGLLYG